MPTATSSAQQGTSEKYYEDVSPLTSDADSGFEDDPVVKHARNSTEIAEHDRELLDEEDEREKLLTARSPRDTPRGFFNRRRKEEHSSGTGGKIYKRTTQKSRKKRRKTKGGSHDKEGELVYEMEEGGPKSETSSQASSSSAELDKMNLAHSSRSRVSFAKSTSNKLSSFSAFRSRSDGKSSSGIYSQYH